MISKQLLFFFVLIVILFYLVTYQLLLTEPNLPQKKTFRQVRPRSPLYYPHSHNFTGNVPDIYLTTRKKSNISTETCGRFPDFFELRFTNDFWQMQETTKGTFYLLNAYVDPRQGGSVRILAAYDVYNVQKKFFCQYWFRDSGTPKTVESGVAFWMFYKKWGADMGYFYHPYLIKCPLVWEDGRLPLSVSLVEKPCDKATNNLKVFNNMRVKKNFVVCVKGLAFPFSDFSTRLVEWIELLRLLGADKINFYEFSVHSNVQKVLDYYNEQGFVETTPITLIGDYSNQPLFQNLFLHKKTIQRRLQEVLPYNDCLYKHLQEYKYVVLLDTDEVIVPQEGPWTPLVQAFHEKFPNVSSFMARNVYFLDSYLHEHHWFSDIPKYMHMLQHVYRAKNYTKPGHFVKGFHDTTKVVALHNHFPFMCLDGRCSSKEMDINLVHLQHYRSDCAAGVSECYIMRNNSVIDVRVWNFKNELIQNVNRTLATLDLLIDDEL